MRNIILYCCSVALVTAPRPSSAVRDSSKVLHASLASVSMDMSTSQCDLSKIDRCRRKSVHVSKCVHSTCPMALLTCVVHICTYIRRRSATAQLVAELLSTIKKNDRHVYVHTSKIIASSVVPSIRRHLFFLSSRPRMSSGDLHMQSLHVHRAARGVLPSLSGRRALSISSFEKLQPFSIQIAHVPSVFGDRRRLSPTDGDGAGSIFMPAVRHSGMRARRRLYTLYKL